MADMAHWRAGCLYEVARGGGELEEWRRHLPTTGAPLHVHSVACTLWWHTMVAAHYGVAAVYIESHHRGRNQESQD